MDIIIFIIGCLIFVGVIYIAIQDYIEELLALSIVFFAVYIAGAILLPLKHLETIEITEFKKFKTDRNITIFIDKYGENPLTYTSDKAYDYQNFDKINKVTINKKSNIFGGLVIYFVEGIKFTQENE
jgi:hypothetical protein